MFDIRSKISARIKASRAQADLTYEEVAARLSQVMGTKIGSSRYGNWELGINIPPYEMVLGLGKVFNKPAAWLGALTDDDGSAPETAGYIVPPLSIVAGGSGPVDLGEPSLAFHRDFLESKGLDPQQVLVLAAPDDSMTGVLEKGDLALIDLRETSVRTDDMFAIVISGRSRLRWIRQNLDGDYVIQAEPKRRDYYPDETLTAEKLKTLHILGRVRMITQLR